MEYKTYVSVTAHFTAQGRMIPSSIEWEDGRVYEIDKILDVRPAASLKAGGNGIRYVCLIHGRRRHLYYENPRWFVPRKGLE